MLAIRLQRTGRSGHAQFRVIVQDSRFSPKRGRVVSYLGNYDPHSKIAVIDSVKASKYLQNGAQPSDRVARLFKKEGIKLPPWVKLEEPKKREVRNPEKRRSTAPAQPEAAAMPPAEEPAVESTENSEQPAAEEPTEDAKAESETPNEEKPEQSELPAEKAAEDSGEKPAKS